MDAGTSLTVLGSTGSVGRQTLDVAAAEGLRVEALTFCRNVALAEEQFRRFRPSLIATPDEGAAADLRVRLADCCAPSRVLGGEEGMLEAARVPGAATVVSAIVGIAGLRPTLAALDAGKRVALSNKECLVCAGELVMAKAAKTGEIVPVDSEHSAIFQCLAGGREVSELILTASGGPFFGMDRAALAHVTVEQALRHPTWRMGPKITVDCATMMNKGLEIIEAMYLFGVPQERIRVAIHREGVVHSLVRFRDGAVLAQMGVPDMRLPIQYAISWPRRHDRVVEELDLFSCPPLTFKKPDVHTFECLELARACAGTKGTSGAILNGANEAAVGLFLNKKIGFLDIPRLVRETLERVPAQLEPGLEDIFEADREARAVVYQLAR